MSETIYGLTKSSPWGAEKAEAVIDSSVSNVELFLSGLPPNTQAGAAQSLIEAIAKFATPCVDSTKESKAPHDSNRSMWEQAIDDCNWSLAENIARQSKGI